MGAVGMLYLCLCNRNFADFVVVVASYNSIST
jgi:hypothetical protein